MYVYIYIYTYTYSSSYFECRSIQKCNIGNTHHLQLQTSGAILSAAQRTYFFCRVLFWLYTNSHLQKLWMREGLVWFLAELRHMMGKMDRSIGQPHPLDRQTGTRLAGQKHASGVWKNCPRLKNVMEYLNNQYARTGLNDVFNATRQEIV